ncbi:Ankyrin repeat family protein [Mycena kentingensis (nom. inval.)]|nr:Ankyrin repeat family protein [Mycena kentingensis (nom. inval.)]
MIIDDVDDTTSPKSAAPPSALPPNRVPEPLAIPIFDAGLAQLPPPYFSYQAVSELPTPATPLLARSKPTRYSRRKQQRRCLVVVSFVLNCFLVALLLRTRSEPEDDGVDPGRDAGRSVEAVVPDQRLGRCVHPAQWSNATRLPTISEFRYQASTTFTFSDPSSLMFLVAQGAHSSGDLSVLPTREALPYVLLTSRYHSHRVRDRANVCWMERAGSAGGAGVGIFTPPPFEGQKPTDKLEFDITLYLPTAFTMPTYNLETLLPSFTHTLDALHGVVEFDRLHLESQNRPIFAESVFACNATIRTTNALIAGTFDASNRLSLFTHNAPIDVTVNLHNQNIFKTSELVLQTRNAQLEAAINLLTTSALGEGGHFNVSTHTTDAPLIVSFPASPAHSTLHFAGLTSNALANVWLNHAFEGEFTLASSMVFVDRRPFLGLDPHKLRSVFYSDWKAGVVTGNVKWKLPIFKSKTMGTVRVETTNNVLKFFCMTSLCRFCTLFVVL